MVTKDPLLEILSRLPPAIAQYVIEKLQAHGAHQQSLERTLNNGERVIVAYFDVLGFGDRTKTPEKAKALYGTYRTAFAASALSTFQAQVSKEQDDWKHPFDKVLRPSVFSDSLFLVTSEVSDEASLQIQQVVNEMTTIFLVQGLPVTGAICTGEVWWDTRASIRLGPGITKAYELASELDLVGIGVSQEVPGPSGETFDYGRKPGRDGNRRPPVRLRVPVRSHAPTQFDWRDVPKQAKACFEKMAEEASAGAKHKYDAGRSIIGSIIEGGFPQ